MTNNGLHMNSEDNFWQAWNAEAMVMPDVIYRCYHDELGRPTCYTTDDLPGDWIVVSVTEFSQASRRVRVRDGALVPYVSEWHRKLRPSDQGTPCHPKHVSVVVSVSEPNQRWEAHNYDTD